MSTNNHPAVYGAVRAVGRLVPQLNSEQRNQGPVFAEKLDVLGTAFWLKEAKVLITCAHVVQELVSAPSEVAGLLVIGNRGNYLPAKVGAIDFEHDLAILRMPPNTPQDLLEQEAATGLTIADENVDIGTTVGYAGFPLGMQLLQINHEPTYAEGVVGAYREEHQIRKQLQITGSVVGGYSGAPIVLKSDPTKVLGVVSSSTSKEAGDANIFLATSWKHLAKLAGIALVD